MFTHPAARRRAHARCLARLLICLALVTATLATVAFETGISAAAPAPVSAGPGCPRWTAVLVPGTRTSAADPAQGQPAGILAPIAHGLQARYGTSIDIHTLDPTTTDGSESGGVQALWNMLARLCGSTRVVLAGYSRGADAVGTVATAIGGNHGPIPASRVDAVALLSDPHRNPTTPQLGPTEPGQGIAGPRPNGFSALAGRVHTACTRQDLTCSTTPQAAPALTALGTTLTTGPTPPGTDTTAANQIATPTPTPGSSAGTESNSLSNTSSSPGALDPAEVIEQVVSVLSGLATFAADVPAIVNDLAQLPGLVTTGNIPGLHQLAGDLNTQFSPLVQAVADIDLHMVAQALELAAPVDASGWTAIAAQIVSILANLDIGRIATDIGQAQEIAWGAVEKLASADPVGAAAALPGLVPVAGDLALTAASAFTGNAGAALSGLAHTFTSTTTPATSTALTDLAHRNTTPTPSRAPGAQPDSDYTTATEHAVRWLISQIDHTA